MTSDERLRVAQQRGLARFPSFGQRPVPGTGFATLDETLWRPLLSVEGYADPALGLAKMGLLSDADNGVRQSYGGGCPPLQPPSRVIDTERGASRRPAIAELIEPRAKWTRRISVGR